MKLFFLVLFSSFIFLINNSHAFQNYSTQWNNKIFNNRIIITPSLEQRTSKIKVVNSITHDPIEDAMIIFEYENINKIKYSDINGLCEIPFDIFDSDQVTITVIKENYTAITLYKIENQPYQIYLPLKKINNESKDIHVKGTLTNFQPIKSNDGILDFGFFLPFINLSDLLTLNPSSFLSPNVTVNIMGDRKIPGNIVIPRQREFLFVVVKKEDFELKMNSTKYFGVSGLSASMSTSSLSVFSSGDIFDIFSQIDMKKFAVKKDYLPSASYFNFPLNYKLEPMISYECILPLNSKGMNISLLNQYKTGIEFIPAAFAVINPDSLKGSVKGPKGIENYFSPYYSLISIIAPNEDKSGTMSIILKRNIDPLRIVKLENYLAYYNINMSSDFNKLYNTFPDHELTDISLSKLVKYNTSQSKEVKTTMYWEIFAPSHIKEIVLPEITESLNISSIIKSLHSNESLRFIQMHFKFDEKIQLENFDENYFLQKISHTAIAETVLRKDQ